MSIDLTPSDVLNIDLAVSKQVNELTLKAFNKEQHEMTMRGEPLPQQNEINDFVMELRSDIVDYLMRAN